MPKVTQQKSLRADWRLQPEPYLGPWSLHRPWPGPSHTYIFHTLTICHTCALLCGFRALRAKHYRNPPASAIIHSTPVWEAPEALPPNSWPMYSPPSQMPQRCAPALPSSFYSRPTLDLSPTPWEVAIPSACYLQELPPGYDGPHPAITTVVSPVPGMDLA